MRGYWKWTVLGCAIGLLAFNANYFDIGRTLDPKLSATAYYYTELDKVPDGQVLMPSHDWEWAAIIPYNKANGRSIIPVCVGVLPSREYREDLERQGVNVGDWEVSIKEFDWNSGQISAHVANYIIAENSGVWTTQTVDAKTYGVEVLLARESNELFTPPPSGITPSWQWKPYSPYSIITGAIEVEGWVNIIQSNYSVLTFGMMGVIGGVPAWIGWNVIVKKKKWSLRRKNANQS